MAGFAPRSCSAAGAEWCKTRGVWPRLTHEEIWHTAWNAERMNMTEGNNGGSLERSVRRIGELAIKAHKKRRRADEITERSEAEGWDNDPTGSLHVSEAWSQSDKANTELAEAIEALDSPNEKGQA